jgi:hypothetical protein
MNDMTVGMENLPNVFIDKIIVNPRVYRRTPLTIQYKVRVVLKMYDYTTDHSWRNRLHGLKVKCAFISDDRIAALNSGEMSLFDIPLGAASMTSAQSCDNFRFSNRRSGYDSFKAEFDFTTLESPQNLNVYAACFIDDLQFGIPLFDKYYGPMAAERIFVAGIPNSRSNYFYSGETNEEYGGPVHLHSSGYMEGSMHSAAPHSRLRLVEEENYKLVVVETDNEVYAGMDMTRLPEENRTELRPGFVDKTPDAQLGPQTNIPDQEVEIEDPNIPTDPLTEIY